MLVFVTLPSEQLNVGAPQSSVAVGAVWLAHVGTVGLQPKSLPAGQDENTGALLSSAETK